MNGLTNLISKVSNIQLNIFMTKTNRLRVTIDILLNEERQLRNQGLPRMASNSHLTCLFFSHPRLLSFDAIHFDL